MDIEQIAAELYRDGYCLQTHFVGPGRWECSLWTRRLKKPPFGTGKTQHSAIMDAIVDKNALEKDAAWVQHRSA
jgi:hypothetical protein